MSQNDVIREDILKYFYDLSSNARSVTTARANEAMVVRALVNKYKRSEIISNLIYLSQAGWIKQEKIEKVPYFTVGTQTVNHFEGASSFQKSQWITGINVTNIQGVTVIGDNNFVHQEFGDLYKNLDLLKSEIGKSAVINDKDKLEYQSDIETIKSQLAKKEPNKTIIEQAWSALSELATIEGVMGLYNTIHTLISSFL